MSSELEIYVAIFQACGALGLLLMLKGSSVPGLPYLAAGYLVFLLSSCLRLCSWCQPEWCPFASGFFFLLAAILLAVMAKKFAGTESAEPEKIE